MGTKIFSGPGAYGKVLQDVRRSMTAAAVNTVNIVAANARQNAVVNVQKDFTLRNNFTVKNIRYDQCPRSVQSINDAKAYVGATTAAPYMARQESGGAHRAATGNVSIPTTATRHGSNANPVSRSMYYSAIKPRIVHGQGKKYHSHKAALVAQAAVASKIGGFIRSSNAVFSVSGFRSKKGTPSFKTKMMYNMKHVVTITKAKPWLQPASTAAASQMQQIYNSQMNKM